MLYIEIPPGMKYQAVVFENEKGESIKEDRFVSISGKEADISIQNMVHEFYHTFHKRHEIDGEIGDGPHFLKFHKRKPSFFQLGLLEYRAVDSGRSPTNHAKILRDPPSMVKNSNVPSHVGRSWMADMPLSNERQKEVDQKNLERRLNLRKLGDSPCAN